MQAGFLTGTRESIKPRASCVRSETVLQGFEQSSGRLTCGDLGARRPSRERERESASASGRPRAAARGIKDPAPPRYAGQHALSSAWHEAALHQGEQRARQRGELCWAAAGKGKGVVAADGRRSHA